MQSKNRMTRYLRRTRKNSHADKLSAVSVAGFEVRAASNTKLERAPYLAYGHPVPSCLLWGSTGGVILSFFTANPLLTATSLLLLPVIFRLLWRRGEPPALLVINSWQWCQAAAHIFYADSLGESVSIVFGGTAYTLAAWLDLCSILAMASGMHFILRNCKMSQGRSAETQGRRILTTRLILAYVIAYFGCGALWALIGIIPRLAQGLASLTSLKWAFVFMMAYSAYVCNRDKLLIGLVTTIEFLSGFLGFFSGFKTVFYVLFMAYFSPRAGLANRRLIFPAILAVALFGVGIVWTAVKTDYRNTLNQGTDEQVVLISISARIANLKSQFDELDSSRLGMAFDALLLRIGTVQILGDVVTYVPSVRPYENGKLWLGAFDHILKPRLFFPNKAEIQDSELTRRYTGIDVAGKDQGTSIGIGFISESYVDFGPVFMFIPIFGVGLLLGIVYWILVVQATDKLLGFALSSCFVSYGFYTLEIAGTKVLGGSLTLLMVYLLFRYFFGALLMNWLTPPLASTSPRGKQSLDESPTR
jgi:hypothetical protein